MKLNKTSVNVAEGGALNMNQRGAGLVVCTNSRAIKIIICSCCVKIICDG